MLSKITRTSKKNGFFIVEYDKIALSVTYLFLFISFFRLKVFFIGPSGGGKTSLVESLLKDSPTVVEKGTETIETSVWEPFKQDASMLGE